MRKQFVTLTLVFSMIASILSSNTMHAAKKIKLNKTKLVLQVGKTYKLKLKNYKKQVKWSSSKKTVATVSKKGNVKAKKAGTAKITAKAGKKKYTCKVQVQKKKSTVIEKNNQSQVTAAPNTPAPTPSMNPPTPSESPAPDVSKQTLIYEYAPATPESYNYNEFKFNSFRIWLCPFIFYGEGYYESKDYRGKKLHYELTIKNSGARDLPLLDLCFNYTRPTVYPTAYRVYDPAWVNADDLVPPAVPDPDDYPILEEDEDGEEYEFTYEDAMEDYEDALNNYNMEKRAFDTGCKEPMKKGETYTYSFNYTIPEDAMNGDYDSVAENNYPIMMYISNKKEYGIYCTGDEITIVNLKIYEPVE